MRHYWSTFLFLLLFCFTKLSYAAQDSLVVRKKKKVRLTPLPVLMYSPETRLGVGALGILNFSLGKDSLTRESYLQSSVIVTINKQIDSDNQLLMFTNEERYMIKGRLRYMHMPEFYFGVGNDLKESNRQLVTYNRLLAEVKLLKRISGKDFLGIYLKSNDIHKLKPEGTGIWQQQPYAGQEGYHISGIGVDLVRDHRDLVYNASKGYFVELSYLALGKYSASEYTFSNYFLDARKYITTLKRKRHVLGFQLLYNGNRGNVPYKDLAEMGGPMMMRGYYRGRYRDKNYTAFQVEYRMPVWKFIGLTYWVGTASVDPTFIQTSLSQWKPNYGVGLRLQMNKKERINVRFDYGFGKNFSGLYVDILEAF